MTSPQNNYWERAYKMLELINLSNCKTDVELIHNSATFLQAFLNRHNLDGVEMLFCAPWDKQIHKKNWIHGVHLMFWPCWLDFWHARQDDLLSQFGSKENIKAYYGCETTEEWLNIQRANIRIAKETEAKYLVFHVSHARAVELFDWQFRASDQDVIEATIEVVNEITAEIPNDITLLFENLWWPGLTLKSQDMVAMLMENVNHANVGIMLDAGHLMNTNLHLKTEISGIKYILETLSQLGEYKQCIKGIHLHRSLTGKYIDDYIKENKATIKHEYTPVEILSHVLRMDEHLPFSTPEVQRIVDYVQPEYLVHEFLQTSLTDWARKIALQQRVLHCGRNK